MKLYAGQLLATLCLDPEFSPNLVVSQVRKTRQIGQPLPPLLTIIHYGSARAQGSLTAIDANHARGRPSISPVDISFLFFLQVAD